MQTTRDLVNPNAQTRVTIVIHGTQDVVNFSPYNIQLGDLVMFWPWPYMVPDPSDSSRFVSGVKVKGTSEYCLHVQTIPIRSSDVHQLFTLHSQLVKDRFCLSIGASFQADLKKAFTDKVVSNRANAVHKALSKMVKDVCNAVGMWAEMPVVVSMHLMAAYWLVFAIQTTTYNSRGFGAVLGVKGADAGAEEAQLQQHLLAALRAWRLTLLNVEHDHADMAAGYTQSVSHEFKLVPTNTKAPRLTSSYASASSAELRALLDGDAIQAKLQDANKQPLQGDALTNACVGVAQGMRKAAAHLQEIHTQLLLLTVHAQYAFFNQYVAGKAFASARTGQPFQLFMGSRGLAS